MRKRLKKKLGKLKKRYQKYIIGVDIGSRPDHQTTTNYLMKINEKGEMVCERI